MCAVAELSDLWAVFQPSCSTNLRKLIVAVPAELFILASTAEVYGRDITILSQEAIDAGIHGLVEDAPVNLYTRASRQALAQEQQLREWQSDFNNFVYFLRLSNVVGSGQRCYKASHLVEYLCWCAVHKQRATIQGSPTGAADYVPVERVARVVQAIVSEPKHREGVTCWNVGGFPLTDKQVVNQVQSRLRGHGLTVDVTHRDRNGFIAANRAVLCSQAMEYRLGFTPCTLDAVMASIDATVDSFVLRTGA